MTRFVRLDSPGCTAIWEYSVTEAPLWRYWGPRLPDNVLPPAPLRETRPEPSFSLQFDQPLSVFPGVGMGWFGQSALLGHREGADWALAITACRVEQAGDATVLFHLSDTVARIDVLISVVLDPETDVLTLSTSLTNAGSTTLDIQWLAAGNIPLPSNAHQVRSFGGRHNGEFVPVTDKLSRSLWRRENRRGLTSHDCFPGAVVDCADGASYGVQLGWSGNHVQQIEWVDDGRWHWQMGEWLAPGEVRLEPDETITAPEMLATCSAGGSDGVTWAFHRAIRKRMVWPGGEMRPRPVHLNTWEGFYFDHDLDSLKELATSAAAIGVERFVLDDGWFHGRNDDRSSLGDWWPDSSKYPDGLAPLADHVVGLGMEFGLWVEPEMVNPDSELFRAHPDWALQIAGRALLGARNQLVLDLTQPDVCHYLYNNISFLLKTLPIKYLKWDHNRDLSHAGDKPLYRRQILAAYALFDRFRQAFPDVEIEACAGGGGRIDAGIVRRTHRFWTSDNIDAVSRTSIQRGFLQFMPPEVMGSHVGASPAHGTGRSQNMAFRMAVAQSGHFGVELDVRKLDEIDRAQLAFGISVYKAMRDTIHQGRTWMGEGADGLTWQAHGNVDDLALFILRTSPPAFRFTPHLPLPMLDQQREYRVESIGADTVTRQGGWLAQAGLSLPPMHAESVLCYRLTALP
jgi:alpha-galactosidase